MKTIILAAIILASTAAAQSPRQQTWTSDTLPKPDRGNKIWIASIITMTAADAADAWTSYGEYESNQYLRNAQGQFGGRAIAIKTAIAGTQIGIEILLRKHHRIRTDFTAANFIQTGIFGYAAWHNTGIPKLGCSKVGQSFSCTGY